MRIRVRSQWLLPVLAAWAVAAPARAVTIDSILIGNPGNAADPDTNTDYCGSSLNLPCGSVAYFYKIGKYEVTNSQYADFLNAVADADPDALWQADMGGAFGGISRSGSSGSYSYALVAGRGSWPVNFVDFYDSLRFINWLHNGQPGGPKGPGTTEDGAYTITPAGITANSIVRNPGALYFMPTDQEWYKAAYYNPILAAYFDYPAGSNTAPTCTAPTATPNSASCFGAYGIAVVGSYTGSASPYGTFDQAGNLWEWNETITGGSQRIVRGGAWNGGSSYAGAAGLSGQFPNQGPFGAQVSFGFRVASIPEPGTGFLALAGLAGVLALRRLRG
jgi:formylglycine-generating enzyme required for sulfatase activity